MQPVLVKTEFITLASSTAIRILAQVAVGIASIFLGVTNTSAYTLLTTAIPVGVLYGITNLAHILSSHYGFTEVDLGVSSALYYLYPIYATLFGAIAGLDPITLPEIAAMVLAVFGVFQIFAGAADYKSWSTSGALAALASGITEGIIIILTRYLPSGFGPIADLMRMYLQSAVILFTALTTPLFPAANENIEHDLKNNTASLYNQFFGHILFGVLGHVLMFFAVQNMRPVSYSVFVLAGALLQPVWGKVIFNEPITIRGSLGIVSVLVAAATILFTHPL